MTVEPRAFRDALSYFASGVCIVTAVGADGAPVGVTVSSFASLSLEPPLVLFCLGKKTKGLEAFTRGKGFAVNVLKEDLEDLSELFAGQSDDKFASKGLVPSDGCFPLLAGCLVGLECSLTATHDGGDHVIVVGRVDRVRAGEGGRPLLRYRGRYARLDRSV